MLTNWTCACCGKTFDTLPMDVGFRAPSNWLGLSEEERSARGKLTADICVIEAEDGTQRFIRGCVEVPVIGRDEKFVWGVWVSVSEKSFRRIHDLWDEPIPEDEPSLFGWLNNWIAGYPEPVEIRCQVYLRSGNLRPRIELQPTDYPLAVEQRHGITLERVKEIVAGNGHG